MTCQHRRDFLRMAMGASCLPWPARSQNTTCSGASSATDRYVLPTVSRVMLRPSLDSFTQWSRFLTANRALLKEGKAARIALANWHTTCCQHGSARVHGSEIFLPWHRVIVHLYEQLLRQYDPAPDPNDPLMVPYWDWENQNAIPSQYEAELALRPFAQNGPVSRDNVLGFPTSESLKSAITALLADNPVFNTFSKLATDGPHSRIHECSGSFMNTAEVAAFDPLFFVHHANMDRLWFRWKQAYKVHACPSDMKDKRIDFKDSQNSIWYVTVGDLWDETKLGNCYATTPSNLSVQFKREQFSQSPSGRWKGPLLPPVKGSPDRFIRFTGIDLSPFEPTARISNSFKIFVNPGKLKRLDENSPAVTTMSLFPAHGSEGLSVDWTTLVSEAGLPLKPQDNEFAILPIGLPDKGRGMARKLKVREILKIERHD